MEKRLYRSCDNRIIAGIAGGLGEYLDIDPTVIRLIFLIALFSGVGVLAYIFAWILIPENPNCKKYRDAGEEIKNRAKDFADEVKSAAKKVDTDEIQDKAKTFAEDVRTTVKKTNNNEDVRVLFGVIILALGVMFLIQTTIGPFIWRIFWPAILVVIGLFIILRK